MPRFILRKFYAVFLTGNYGTGVTFVQLLHISSCSHHSTNIPYLFIAFTETSSELSQSVYHNLTSLLGFHFCHGTCLDTEQGNSVLYFMLSFIHCDADLYGKLINVSSGSASLICIYSHNQEKQKNNSDWWVKVSLLDVENIWKRIGSNIQEY